MLGSVVALNCLRLVLKIVSMLLASVVPMATEVISLASRLTSHQTTWGGGWGGGGGVETVGRLVMSLRIGW